MSIFASLEPDPASPMEPKQEIEDYKKCRIRPLVATEVSVLTLLKSIGVLLLAEQDKAYTFFCTTSCPESYTALWNKCATTFRSITCEYLAERRKPTVNNRLFLIHSDTLPIISSHKIKEGLKQRTNGGQSAIAWKTLVVCLRLQNLSNFESTFSHL